MSHQRPKLSRYILSGVAWNESWHEQKEKGNLFQCPFCVRKTEAQGRFFSFPNLSEHYFDLYSFLKPGPKCLVWVLLISASTKKCIVFDVLETLRLRSFPSVSYSTYLGSMFNSSSIFFIRFWLPGTHALDFRRVQE